jgi:hypothetical protein
MNVRNFSNIKGREKKKEGIIRRAWQNRMRSEKKNGYLITDRNQGISAQ